MLSVNVTKYMYRDDPVDKFFPGFTYIDGGWADLDSAPLAPAAVPRAPITLRQLVSHMSGLSREYPRGNMKNWPHSVEGAGPSPLNGCPFPTTQEVIEGLQKYPLVVPTYSYPVYSNAGIAVLGEATVAANAAFEKEKGTLESPPTWQALVRRDVFDPLGLNGSFFVVTPENRPHVAVSSLNSDEVVSQLPIYTSTCNLIVIQDMDFLDPMSCSGGQMSSLSDYIKVMLTILDPTRPESLLPPHVIREWLRPLYGWTDETTEVGMLWEIEKIYDSYERPIRIFQKRACCYECVYVLLLMN
jgi:CubicO group peptidase (beta-lactamase class C family)